MLWLALIAALAVVVTALLLGRRHHRAAAQLTTRARALLAGEDAEPTDQPAAGPLAELETGLGELGAQLKELRDARNGERQPPRRIGADLAPPAVGRTTPHLDSILDTMTDAMLAVDADRRIIWFNSAMCALTGRDRADVLGTRCTEATTNGSWCHDCPMDRVMAAGQPWSSERQYHDQAKDESRTLHVRGAPLLDTDGQITGCLEIWRDVTDLKSLQTQLSHSSKLAMVGRFAAVVSHELRTPLTAIKTVAYYLETKLKDDRPGLIEQTTTIQSEVDAANKIIEDILEFARPADLSPEPLDLNQLILETCAAAAGRETLGGLRLDTDLDPTIPPVLGDGQQLVRVFNNLMTNASQAMGGAGSLLIKTEPGPDGQLLVKFVDDGPGIEEKDLRHIFEPFYTTRPRGTGLGLAIVEGIVERHGGKIEVESVLSEGTTFTTFLPAASPA